MAGRPTGSLNKNKDKLLRNLKEVYGDDFDPIMKMAAIASKEENDDTLRLNAWKEVAQYVYPKLKAVEISQGEDENGERKAWTINIISKDLTSAE